MFPPGRARLATNPLPTGSLSCVMTMGIVAVASLAARVGTEPGVTMMSTLRRTSSAASAGRRSSFPSAYRYSIAMFFPSTYVSSRRPCRKASVRSEMEERETPDRYPIRGIFVGCCASAGGAVVSKTVASNQTKIFRLIVFTPVPALTPPDA